VGLVSARGDHRACQKTIIAPAKTNRALAPGGRRTRGE